MTIRSRTGFSLIEVVVAVGIFAIAIVSILGLLGPINKSVSDVRDFDDASRVVASIQSTLQDTGFSTVIGLFSATETVYADRSGRRVAVESSPVWSTDIDGNDLTNDQGNILSQAEIDGQKFFEVSLVRNDTLSPVINDSTAGFLAFTITLRWPGYTPDGTKFTATSQQSVMIVPSAITR